MKKIFFIIAFILPLSFVCLSQDSLTKYSDQQMIKLVNHIKFMEAKTAPYITAHPNETFVSGNNAEAKKIIADIAGDSMSNFTDANVIKLANYIKYLGKVDSMSTADWIASRKKIIADSLASIAATQVKDVVELQKSITFNFNSSTLKPESYKVLDEVVKILKTHNDLNFFVEGYTDNIGSDAYNINLSKARAKSVETYFVSKGIPKARITSVGYGKEKPVATNATDAGRAQNRRVEIKEKK